MKRITKDSVISNYVYLRGHDADDSALKLEGVINQSCVETTNVNIGLADSVK